MAQPYQEQPGVYIYDSFSYPENREVYMTAVVAEIDELQYWRDIPLLIKQPIPTGADNINFTPADLASLGGQQVEEQYQEVQDLPDANQQQRNAFNVVLEEIKNFGPYDVDPNDNEPETLENEIIIKNMQGEIINSLTLDSKTQNEITNGPLTRIVNTVDVTPTQTNDESINILADEDINENLEYLMEQVDEYIGLLDEASDTYKFITDQIKDINDAAPPVNIPDEEDQERFNEKLTQMSTPFNQWYGIPIINLGPDKLPTGESYILNVNTFNNWNLELTNIVTNGLDSNRLYIDKQIPPGKKFIAGFFMLYGQFSIFLRIEGEDKIYQKTVRYNYDTAPQAISYGVDNDFLKTICGTIWDIYYWKQDTNFNHNLPSPSPSWPNKTNVHVFDFNEYNLSGNTIYTIQEYGNVAYGGSGPNITVNRKTDIAMNETPGATRGTTLSSELGSGGWPAKFYHLQPQPENISPSFPGIHPWHFLYNSYIDKFFCRNKLRDGDFALIWYQWLFFYPVGLKNLVSDNIYNNFVNYDFTNFKLIIDFNGRHYEEYIVLPEKVWAQFAVRYKKDEGKLIFSFTDFYGDFKEELEFDIGDDLEFELMSMFAQYSREDQEYKRNFQGLCGMILVYEEFPTNEDLHTNYESVKPYLKQYLPKEQ